jgi:hypothetical protein
MWHSRPRLCILNQNGRGAHAPGCGRLGKHRRPAITASRYCPVIVFLECDSSYKQNTNLLYHHVSFLSSRNSAAKRSTGERKEHFVKSREEA